MKKFIFILILLVCFLPFAVNAQEEMPDLSQADNALVKEEYTYLLPSEILESILKNEYELSGQSLLENLINMLFKCFKSFLPEIFSLFAVSIIISIVSKLEFIKPNSSSLALLGGRIIICVTLLTSFLKIAKSIKQSITVLVNFFQKLLPVLSTVFVFSGAQSSAASMQASASILIFILLKIVNGVVITLIISATVIKAIDLLLQENKLKGIGHFFSSASSWILGGSFTLFCGYSAVAGITASVADNMKIRSLKYAVNSSVPIIGGSVGESLNFIIAGANCLKSAVGVTGMIVACTIMIMPIINIFAIMLVLKFFVAISSAWTDEKVAKLIETVSEGYKMLLILLVGICAVFLLFLGLMACLGGGT